MPQVPSRAAAPSPTSALSWRPIRYPDLGLTIAFPLTPERQDAGSAAPGAPLDQPAITLLSAELDGRAYELVHVNMAPSRRPRPANPSQALDQSVLGKLQQGQVLEQKPLAFPGGVAREITVRQQDRVARIRLFSRWPELYAVLVAAPAAQAAGLTGPEAQRFFASVTLAPGPASAAPHARRSAPVHRRRRSH